MIVSVSSAYLTTTKALISNGYSIYSSNVECKDSTNNTITNVQAAIDGTCSKIDTRLTSLEKHSIRSVTATISGGCATVTHNLNLSNYYPLVSLGSQQSHSYVIYTILNITSNSFKVCVGSIDNYVLAPPTDGWTINLVWTY